MLNKRDRSTLHRYCSVAQSLWDYMGLDLSLQDYVDVILQARRAIQYCYVSWYYATNGAHEYEAWIGEMEALTSSIETSLNLEHFAEVDIDDVSVLEVERAFGGRDLRDFVARGVALHRGKGVIEELCLALRIRQQHICEAVRLQRLSEPEAPSQTLLQRLSGMTNAASTATSTTAGTSIMGGVRENLAGIHQWLFGHW